jgi:hypothetical protein
LAGVSRDVRHSASPTESPEEPGPTYHYNRRHDFTVGGGIQVNSTTVIASGKLTILDQNPPASEDPVLNRAIVGGYLRDGALHVNGGTVTSPKIKPGVTSGKMTSCSSTRPRVL